MIELHIHQVVHGAGGKSKVRAMIKTIHECKVES